MIAYAVVYEQGGEWALHGSYAERDAAMMVYDAIRQRYPTLHVEVWKYPAALTNAERKPLEMAYETQV